LKLKLSTIDQGMRFQAGCWVYRSLYFAVIL